MTHLGMNFAKAAASCIAHQEGTAILAAAIAPCFALFIPESPSALELKNEVAPGEIQIRRTITKDDHSSSTTTSSPIRRVSHDVLGLWFAAVPPVARYFFTGLIGNAIFFLLDQYLSGKILLNVMENKGNVDSVSFFLAYLIQILPQHFLNSLLVFGMDTIDSRDKYFKSLRVSYSSYFVTLCGSTILNAILLRNNIPKTTAFWGSIASFAIVNYMLISSYEKKKSVVSVEGSHGLVGTAETTSVKADL
jgi:hypothetical protein